MSVVRFAVLVALCVLVLELLAGGVLDLMFRASRSGEQAGLTNQILAEAVDAEVHVYGSSRVQCHVDPSQLTELTGLRAYNLGMSGQDLAYARAMQLLLRSRGAEASCVVVNVDERELFRPTPERVSMLRVYAGEDPGLDELLSEHIAWFGLKRHFRLWRYNSRALALLANWGEVADLRGGFVPVEDGRRILRQAGEDPGYWTSGEHRHPNAQALGYLRGIVADTRAQGGEVLVVSAPRLGGSAGNDNAVGRARTAEVLEQWAATEGVVYEDLHERLYPEFRDPSLWTDPGHLTSEGAAVFTRVLATHIRRVCVDRAP